MREEKSSGYQVGDWLSPRHSRAPVQNWAAHRKSENLKSLSSKSVQIVVVWVGCWCLDLGGASSFWRKMWPWDWSWISRPCRNIKGAITPSHPASKNVRPVRTICWYWCHCYSRYSSESFHILPPSPPSPQNVPEHPQIDPERPKITPDHPPNAPNSPRTCWCWYWCHCYSGYSS